MNPQNKPHPLADLIHSYADGARIQMRLDDTDTWKDVERPSFNEECYQYRIKPEEPSNDPWKPKDGEKYFFLDVIEGEICAYVHRWEDDEIDDALCRNHNIFPTKEEAEAAIPRVKAALKGDFATENNVGSKSEIDGKPLTNGEKELIRAFRYGRLCRQFFGANSVIVEGHDNVPKGVVTHRDFVAFFMDSPIQNWEVRVALGKIQAEQEEGR